MKKFFISLIGAACFTVIVVSCNKREGVEVAPTQQEESRSMIDLMEKEDGAQIDPTQEKEPTSMIDLMEKEDGLKFFRRDVTLKDASGRNKIVMRFAAVDEDALDYYLRVREYTVIPNPNDLETNKDNLTKT